MDGFDDDEQLYADEQVDMGQGRGNPLAFPQSDDEEISTDGKSTSCRLTGGWSYSRQYMARF